jgi:hypothetical protein
MQKKTIGGAKHDLASSLYDGTVVLPFAQQTARREWTDACSVCQFLVCGFKFEPVRSVPANGLCQASQDTSQPLAGSVADQCYVSGRIESEIAGRSEQRVL